MKFSRIFVSVVLVVASWDETSAFAPKSRSSANRKTASTTELNVAGSSLIPKVAIKAGAAAAGAALAGTGFVKLVLDKPTRIYEESASVGDAYDSWTDDGILEYYWGEHIHLGYYSEDVKYRYKALNEAQYAFIDEMMKFGGIDPATDSKAKVLDVGCGFGGTSRYLARALGPDAEVTAITLSPRQVERATELAEEQNTPNAKFMVQDALAMDFPDNSFDIVWACESGEHMPDKKAYIDQMMRVLKPGGKFVMATWCQRDDREVPFDKRDKRDLQYLYDQWSHPHFISKEAYGELIDATGVMSKPKIEDWKRETLNSWRHTIWKGVKDPRGWIFKPKKYLKNFRDAWCIERMHRAFKRGLMEYGMFAATKKESVEEK